MAVFVRTDVSDAAQMDNLKRSACETYGKVDCPELPLKSRPIPAKQKVLIESK
jgi:hypothetical protein